MGGKGKKERDRLTDVNEWKKKTNFNSENIVVVWPKKANSFPNSYKKDGKLDETGVS